MLKKTFAVQSALLQDPTVKNTALLQDSNVKNTDLLQGPTVKNNEQCFLANINILAFSPHGYFLQPLVANLLYIL